MPQEPKVSLDIRRKRLAYRANYRGFKEADLLLGGFAIKYGNALTEQEMDQFEELLAEFDHDIYDWLTGVRSVPAQYDTPLFQRIKAFKPL